ncbi:hypothetical protein ACJQWK_06299 [Exserohilum turcicum]|uniref:RING-type domain-containing protein n=1 Tax=Exserohilum turcicum (strain 28A) TaxID=671987 RepID=R0KAF7_EXST2|nr:uncharacterized protein SETTUDRAFT_154777 [Exserohilum turcica Et28A]EOA85192.1 hypothetical protein SETTUDRAFT_154777 [Exserohilum turcica Et28A]
MENFFEAHLHPADTCNICTEHFSATHKPVALPCQHIFGHKCIRKWFIAGRGNTNACPICRYVLVPKKSPRKAFNIPSVWQALCDQPPDRLEVLMGKIWSRLQDLWQQHPKEFFNVTSILDQAIIPALIYTTRCTRPSNNRENDPVLDCYNLVAASWDSLGRPNLATGLAVPLVRLARLMASAGAILPKWLTTNSRTNRLIWRANACLPITVEHISWEYIIDGAKLTAPRYFPLLHLYTVFISQSIAHFPAPQPYPSKRHDVMNLVVERCCVKIGGGGCAWRGKPSNAFKDTLVVIYEELRRYQLEKGKMSLRGHDDEDFVVRGIWALASWSTGKVKT